MTKQRNKKAKKHIIYIYKKRHDNDMTQDDDPHYEINYTQKIASAKHNNEKNNDEKSREYKIRKMRIILGIEK